MGVRLFNLGFAADRGRDEDGVQFRGRVIDSEQLGALKEKFGLTEDEKNPDGHDTSQPGVTQACDDLVTTKTSNEEILRRVSQHVTPHVTS